MILAIPSKGTQVDDHFGHCEFYRLFTVEDSKIVSEKRLDSPAGCGCKSNIAQELARQGVSVMLAGNMGQGAVNKVSAAGIKVIRGCSGDVREVMESFISGTLRDSGETCADHGDGHECSH
jgi:predicted Fe-Mo cluster-binding NifX family protein